MSYNPSHFDPALQAQLRALAAHQNIGEGRSLEELLSSNDPVRGSESQRLRSYFTSNCMEPQRDLDGYGRAILMGDIANVKSDFSDRVSRLLAKAGSEEGARTAAVQELYDVRWGPTRVPIYNLLLLSTIIFQDGRPQHLQIARWLISEAKVPVNGTDVSGSQAIYHAISTKPTFDPEFAQILYDADADVNHRNRYGGTTAHEIALIWDMRNRSVVRLAADALAWFLTHGGNIDVKDNDGMTVRQCVDNTRRITLTPGGGTKLPTWGVVDREDKRRKQLGNEVCTFCGRGPEGEKGLLTCSRCKKAVYCAPQRKCQRGDWPKHKPASPVHRSKVSIIWVSSWHDTLSSGRSIRPYYTWRAIKMTGKCRSAIVRPDQKETIAKGWAYIDSHVVYIYMVQSETMRRDKDKENAVHDQYL